ncbi:hypothetical protein JW859_08170 [bacterium]|nr:hypothetical protein [bacterium]
MRLKFLLVTSMLMSIGLLQSACSSGILGGENVVTAYLPYIEAVVVKDTYSIGEPIEVQLQMPASLNPDILQGLQPFTVPEGSWIDVWIRHSSSTITLRPWISEPIHNGQAVSQFAFDLGSINTEGTYRLVVQTADSEDWGGLSAQYNAGSPYGDIPEHEHAVYREYTFAVLPAEEQ